MYFIFSNASSSDTESILPAFRQTMRPNYCFVSWPCWGDRLAIRIGRRQLHAFRHHVANTIGYTIRELIQKEVRVTVLGHAGGAHIILVPEIPFTFENICAQCQSSLCPSRALAVHTPLKCNHLLSWPK